MCSFLYKSIEYSDEKYIKNVNLYRTIKFKVRQFYMSYKVAIIHLILTFIMFRMVVYIYASVDDPKLETTFSVFVFTLVLRMFDISFGKADEGVHRVSKAAVPEISCSHLRKASCHTPVADG